MTADCDRDTLLARIVQLGAACHTGSHSCFFEKDWEDEERAASATRTAAADSSDASGVLERDYRTITDRRAHAKEGSYTNYLFDKGLDKMLKKLGEENTEIIIAAKNPDPTEIVYEIADYLYHMMVVMAERGVSWEQVTDELVRRQKKEEE